MYDLIVTVIMYIDEIVSKISIYINEMANYRNVQQFYSGLPENQVN